MQKQPLKIQATLGGLLAQVNGAEEYNFFLENNYFELTLSEHFVSEENTVSITEVPR